MDERLRETVETYNHSAVEFARQFQGIGPRTVDIEKALDLIGSPDEPYIFEIGCGNGRDASEILEYTPYYRGIDISDSFVALAKESLPDAEIEQGDILEYELPRDLDIVFAFASLLHLSPQEIEMVCEKVAFALKPGGIFYISLKYAKEYYDEIQDNPLGRRVFYYYNPEMITQIAGSDFEVAHTQAEMRGTTQWFEIALRKLDL